MESLEDSNNVLMNVIKWDWLEDGLASLSVDQKARIFNLEEEVNTSKEENLQNYDDNNVDNEEEFKEKIENYDELLKHYTLIEMKYDLEKCLKYSMYLEKLKIHSDECNNLLIDINKTLSDFSLLSKQYSIVSGKTTKLHNATEELILEQDKLNNLYNDVSKYIDYYKQCDFILEKLEMPNLSVKSDLFISLIDKIETNIDFIENNIKFKESPIYLVKYRHCQSKAISMIQQWIYDVLNETTDSITSTYNNNNNTTSFGNTPDTALILFYGKYQSILPKLKPIIDIIEKRSINKQEYENLLNECQQYYLMKRGNVLGTSVRKGLTSIKDSYKGDHCTLVRQACALLLHASIDEYKLFYQFFSIKSSTFNDYLEGLCSSLYDALRPSIIHINHLETLSEICCILKIEMLEEHVPNNIDCLNTFGNVCLQLLHDAQERLVFRTNLYLQSDIIGYNPSPGDLAYPDKLKMMENIAETLREENRQARIKKISVSTVSSFLDDSTSTVVTNSNNERNNITESMLIKSNTSNSPADLHGMWYPTVRRTLVCLSRLHRCLDRPVFQSLSREAITYCVDSIENAKNKITLKSSELDGELFQIKHLLILREQIAPFQVDFTVKEYSLDFSKVKSAAFGLLEKRSRLFTLSNNALLEFILEGAPQMKEHLIDSRKHVDIKLKLSCQRFIQHSTELLIQPIILFLDKIKLIKNQLDNINDNDIKNPIKLSEIISESLRSIKFKLPNIQQSMQLYLANRETEFILFRPIKNNVVGSFSQLLQYILNTFDNEQQLLIACPLPEQISVMLCSTTLTNPRNHDEQFVNQSANQSNDQSPTDFN